jgi:uncharacterized protein (TIGR03067 family)
MHARIGICLIVAVLSFAVTRPADGQSEKKGLSELQGTWKLERFEVDGEDREFPAKLPRWVIKGNKVMYGREELALLTVDAATNPRSIDLDFRKAKRVDEGIVAVDADKLKICISKATDSVKERPLDFATGGKPARRLLVFAREKPGADDGSTDGPGFVGMQIKLDTDTDMVIVDLVLAGSPAQKAGLKKDDRLLKVGGAPPTTVKSTVDLVRQARPGSDLVLSIRRGDKERDITIRVGVAPFLGVVLD